MRRKAWRWGLGITILVGVIAGLIVGDAFRRADAIVERARGVVRGLAVRLKARPVRRPPLFEPPYPGNAWEVYGPVLHAFEDMPNEDLAEIPGLQVYLKMKAAPLDETVLAKVRPQAARLQDALRCGTADPALPFEEGYRIDFPYGRGVELACRYLAEEAHFQALAGNADACVRGLLTGIGLAQDVVRCGSIHHQAIGIVGESVLLRAAQDILAGGRLPRVSLEGLSSGLERLEAWRFNLEDGLEVDRYFRLIGLLERPGFHLQLTAPVPEAPGFRDLYSERISTARALAVEERLTRRLAALAKGPSDSWEDGVTDLEGEFAGEACGPALLYEAARRLEGERRSRAFRIVLRTTVGVARFRAEAGAFPPSLAALVPRFLPELPRCPRSGEPLETQEGRVWTPAGGDLPR